MRGLPHPAGTRLTAIALTVLAVSAAGGAYAATRDASRKITVCVRRHGGGVYQARHCARHDRKLSWNTTGPRGPVGATGAAGQPGPPGPLMSTLPSGRTETGAYYAVVYAQTSPTLASASVSFPIPLASPPAATFLAQGAAPTPTCPGSSAAPAAAPGNLCVYEGHSSSHTSVNVFDPASGNPGSSAFGAGLLFRENTVTGAGIGSQGTWAVTAP